MLYQVFGNVLFDNTSSLMTETTFSNLISSAYILVFQVNKISNINKIVKIIFFIF